MGKVAPRIALVHDFLYTYGGAERVLKALHVLYPDAPIYTTFYTPAVVDTHFPKASIITSSLQKSHFHTRPQLLLSRIPKAVEEWDFSDFDIVISSSGAFSHGIITGPHTTHISYCHSPMRYAWDWHAENLRERKLNKGFVGTTLQHIISNLRLWDAVSAKRVDVWLANSKTVQARIKKYYRAHADVVYPPIDTSFFNRGEVSEIQGNFAFTISRLSPNKHIEDIITACHAVKLPLIIAGGGKHQPVLEKLAKELNATVTFLGPVSEEKKRTLFATARCFIFAAEDDFGIAPVESLAMGTPVVGLGRGGLTETVQPGITGILYHNQTTEDLRGALEFFLKNGVSASQDDIAKTAQQFNTTTFEQAIQKLVAKHA